MKVLIGVINCHSRLDFQQTVRDTWLKSVPPEVDVKFFLGPSDRDSLPDEVFLSCDDSYEGLPSKVSAMFRWALENGYDYCMKFDDDSMLLPTKWMAGFHRCDFTGCKESACRPGEIATPYGFAYVLSKRSMELVVATPLPGEPGSTHANRHNNDEAFVSTILYVNGIFLDHDPRYFLHRGGRPKPAVRSLRAPKRDSPFVVVPPSDCFAICIYLNWSGFHQTPKSELMSEYHYMYERYAKQ